MKTWYRESAENVLRDMGSSRSGLTQQQAEAVRKKAGENVLQEGTGKKAWQVFFGTVSGSSGDNPDCCSRDFHGI